MIFLKLGHECPSPSGGHLRETQGNIKAAKCEDLTSRALALPDGKEDTHTADTATSQVASWRRHRLRLKLKDEKEFIRETKAGTAFQTRDLKAWRQK